MGLFTLFEYGAVLRKSRRAGPAQDFTKLVGAESRKQRQMGNQRRIDCGHVSPAVSAASIESRLRLRPAIKRKFALAQYRRAAFPLNDNQTGPHGADDQWRTTMRKVMTLATIAVLMSVAGAAAAAEVEVKMLNKGTEGLMVFEPALVK